MTASASPPTDPETRPSSAPPSARTSTRSTTRAAAARTRRFELPLPFICVVGLVGLIVGMVVLRNEWGPRPPSPEYADAPHLLPTLAGARPEGPWAAPAELGALLTALWDETEPDRVPEVLRRPVQPVYAALRADGTQLVEHWGTQGPTQLHALREALAVLRPHAHPSQDPPVLTLELAFSHPPRTQRLPDASRFFRSRATQGIVGFEFSWQGHVERHSPTSIVAANVSHDHLLGSFLSRQGIGPERLGEVGVRTFAAQQVLHVFGPEPRTFLMDRGNRLVTIDEVSEENVRQLADLARTWLFENLDERGRMTYLVRPSDPQVVRSNNMVRQWMATVAMGRAAHRDDDAEAWAQVARNIDYNLRAFYRERDGHGLILYGGKVKLGAVALAALALLEHPNRERWRAQEAALQRSMRYLWNDDGSFQGFYLPEGRNGQQNFYPGEALLYWAFLYRENRDPELLARIRKSFEYYREWHLTPENRNPAFVPWHTQAYTVVWDVTRDEEMQAFIFEMNDWLVDTMLEWNPRSALPDLQGRYYNARLPFGIPHASSTGVYLEGLIDAFRIARTAGDRERAERYRLAILRGLRSIMQLQFVDEVDMFYIPRDQRRRVLGGIRTDVHNNEIRCDNVQHNLMGILKILDTFAPEDYRHP